jgi:hypothetical protein
MRRLVLFLLIVFLLAEGERGQERTAQTLAQPDRFQKALDAIKRKRPEIPTSVLQTDTQTIDESLDVIKTIFVETGLDDANASESSLIAWRNVRLNSPLQPDKPMDANSFVEFVTLSTGLQAIKRRLPTISYIVLSLDAKTIDQALPKIKTKFLEIGLDEADAVGVAVVAWNDVRLNSPLQPVKPMDGVSFVQFATSDWGLVKFKADVEKAEVYVDGGKIGSTEMKKWYKGGSIKVLFKKDDLSYERDFVVTAPGFNLCEGKLKPN